MNRLHPGEREGPLSLEIQNSMDGFMVRVWTIGALCVTFWCFGAETNLSCDPEKEYEHKDRCCQKCEPGKHIIKRCTSSEETKCNPCGPNEYMSVWNNDLNCVLHKVCDKGYGLIVLHNGNSTHPRECVCTEGYHFDSNQKICMENKNCNLGLGVQLPVKQNEDTNCVPCQEGYFSNISSSTEPCQPWTNCSEFGLHVIVPGTNKSDAICDRLRHPSKDVQTIIIIIALIVSLALILFICALYMKKSNTLKVQVWIQETCEKICRSEKNSHYREPNTIDHGYTIIPNATVVENIHCENLKEIETPRGRLEPMEDEYKDPRRSPEPENESIAAGVESLSDLESGSLGNFHAYSDTSSDRLFSSNEEVTIPPCTEHRCDQTAKETSRKRRDEPYFSDPVDNNNGPNSSRHEFHIYPQASYHIPEKNTDKEPCSCFTNAQYTRSSSRSSADNFSTFSETPPTPSGNVTGNNNTTVISSAPVMNIKTDMVVVYYRGSSQDENIPRESEENIKRPMQEERQDHCDNFVANTPPYKYNDISCSSVPDTDCTEGDGNLRDSNINNQNTYFPVQEEGKPEFYY